MSQESLINKMKKLSMAGCGGGDSDNAQDKTENQKSHP